MRLHPGFSFAGKQALTGTERTQHRARPYLLYKEFENVKFFEGVKSRNTLLPLRFWFRIYFKSRS